MFAMLALPMENPTPDKEAQSQRVKDFMNYQIMSEMKEYEAEFDQMLFYPLQP